jgi:membrane glycosyltransferase
MPSRLHLALGIMTYLSSPLWLLLLLVSAIEMMNFTPPPEASFIGLQPALGLSVSHAAELVILVAATMLLLFGPKIMALVVLLEDAEATRAHGGTGAVIGSVIWECLFSTLMAPIVMLQHSWYVVTILMGISTGWGSQHRTDRALPLDFVARHFWPHTLVGVAATIILWDTASFGWFVPLLAGLWLSIPLVIATSSPLLGRLTRQDKLFLVPSETRGLPVQDRAHALVAQAVISDQDVRRLVLEDAQVRAMHLMLLAGNPAATLDAARLDMLRQRAARRETADFSREDWVLVLHDAEGLRALP